MAFMWHGRLGRNGPRPNGQRDFSLTQYLVFFSLFPCPRTAVGDVGTRRSVFHSVVGAFMASTAASVNSWLHEVDRLRLAA